MNDIESHADCRQLVERFYARVRDDDLLGPIFEARLSGRWPEHLGIMASFWAAVVLGEPGYSGRPLERHVGLGIAAAHFDRWVALWTATVDASWTGPRAEHAKRSARHIAERMATYLGVSERPAVSQIPR